MHVGCKFNRWLNAAASVQAKVDETYRDRAKWTRMSIMSTAGSAFFSSDRTIVRFDSALWPLVAM